MIRSDSQLSTVTLKENNIHNRRVADVVLVFRVRIADTLIFCSVDSMNIATDSIWLKKHCFIYSRYVI